MNKDKDNNYELYILDYILSVENYDSAWLWRDIPKKILLEEKIITDSIDYSCVRENIGINILAEKDEQYVYINCINHASTINVSDLAEYSFFRCLYRNKKCRVYYNGHLSNVIKYMCQDTSEFINVPFNNQNFF